MFDELLKDIRKRMENADIQRLSDLSGKHRNVLFRIRTGRDKNPTINTLEAINAALDEMEIEDGD